MNDFVREKICFFVGRPSVYELMDYAVRFGAAGVELMNFCDELSTPDMKIARDIGAYAKKNGLKIPCFSAGINFATGDRSEKVKRIKGYVDICSQLEIPYLHHTLVIALNEPSDYAAAVNAGIESAHEIYEYAKEKGVKTLLEEQGYVFNGVKGYALLNNPYTQNCGALLDVGNIMFVDERAEDFMPFCEKKIAHVHLKDYKVSDEPPKNSDVIKSLTNSEYYRSRGGKYISVCELGTGDVNYPAISEKLKDIGYGGHYSLEFDSMPDDAELLRVLDRMSGYFGE